MAEPQFRVQLGFAATAADLEVVQKQTHDLLIDSVGGLRTSGVSWLIYAAKVAAPRVLDRLDIDLDRTPELGQAIRDYPNGSLVVAMCEVAG